MATVTHKVSFRNGPQVMVAGLKLHALGYGRGATVVVSEAAGTSANPPWRFVVDNDEHATLVSRSPTPPAWIQPGVVVRIEVTPAAGAGGDASASRAAMTRPEVVRPTANFAPSEAPLAPAVPAVVSASDLREWRAAVVRILNSLEPKRPGQSTEGFAGRISRLSREGRIPSGIAKFMQALGEFRNQSEYQETAPSAIESEALSAAWRAVVAWDKDREKA